jgi:transcriptional regulator with GAF, ATPase, and Fis domain
MGSAATDNVPNAPVSLGDARRIASDDAERAFLERGLTEVGGTVAELARRYDMNRSHLQMLLKKHGIHSKDFRTKVASEGSQETR